MSQKTIIIMLVIIVVVLLGAVGYLLMTQNIPSNNTTNNTTISNNKTQGTTPVNQTTSSNSNVNISAAKAKSIATDYLALHPDIGNVAASTPSLKGSIYYVPMVVTNNEGQHPKGTVVGNIKIDAKTGQVLGIQEISMV